MDALIAIGLFTATVVVGELRHRYQDSLLEEQSDHDNH